MAVQTCVLCMYVCVFFFILVFLGKQLYHASSLGQRRQFVQRLPRGTMVRVVCLFVCFWSLRSLLRESRVYSRLARVIYLM